MRLRHRNACIPPRALIAVRSAGLSRLKACVHPFPYAFISFYERAQNRPRRLKYVGNGRDTIKLKMPAKRVEIDDRQLAIINKALSDPRRFQILQLIAETSTAPTCSCVRDWTGLAPATVSHHLKELDTAGLIHVKRNGKFANLAFRRDVWKAYLRKLSTL